MAETNIATAVVDFKSKGFDGIRKDVKTLKDDLKSLGSAGKLGGGPDLSAPLRKAKGDIQSLTREVTRLKQQLDASAKSGQQLSRLNIGAGLSFAGSNLTAAAGRIGGQAGAGLSALGQTASQAGAGFAAGGPAGAIVGALAGATTGLIELRKASLEAAKAQDEQARQIRDIQATGRQRAIAAHTQLDITAGGLTGAAAERRRIQGALEAARQRRADLDLEQSNLRGAEGVLQGKARVVYDPSERRALALATGGFGKSQAEKDAEAARLINSGKFTKSRVELLDSPENEKIKQGFAAVEEEIRLLEANVKALDKVAAKEKEQRLERLRQQDAELDLKRINFLAQGEEELAAKKAERRAKLTGAVDQALGKINPNAELKQQVATHRAINIAADAAILRDKLSVNRSAQEKLRNKERGGLVGLTDFSRKLQESALNQDIDKQMLELQKQEKALIEKIEENTRNNSTFGF